MMAALMLFVVSLLWLRQADRRQRGLVVYCAHDLLYAEPILRDFERRTGIPVEVVGDTEASKSLGLIQRLLREPAGSCDVLWNNQIAGTDRLQQAGLLIPYRGTGWNRIPERFKDFQGHWTGFAARMRLWITRAPQLAANQQAIHDFLAKSDWSHFAIAKPMYGTTLTQYSVYQEQWGLKSLRAWHQQFQNRGGKFVPGNAAVKDLVAAGACVLGMTDTDDYFVARDDHADVAMRPIELGDLNLEAVRELTFDPHAVFVIPNTVAILRGTQRLPEAQQLVDYLLSAETELKLARSTSRQIPLGGAAPEELPPEVLELLPALERALDLRNLTAAQAACLEWLSNDEPAN